MQQEGFGTFWDRSDLSPLEHACLSSFTRADQPISLFSYEKSIARLPEGVILRDASEVLPLTNKLEDVLKKFPARFSDLFRLTMMQVENLIWVDCDVYFLRPINVDANLVTIGREFRDGTRFLWNGVMYLDPSSDLFADYMTVLSTDRIQFRESWDTKVDIKDEDKSARTLFDRIGHVNFFSADLPRNFFGPVMLSLLALDHQDVPLTPSYVHYPYGAPKLRKNIHNPQNNPLKTPKNSETIHFYGSMVRSVCQRYWTPSSDQPQMLPPGSLLAQALDGTLSGFLNS